MWKYSFDAEPGTRVLRSRFIGITHFTRVTDLWWYDAQRRWCKPSEVGVTDWYGNTAPCNSFKAFKRHLRKHPELRTVDEVILVSRFKGHDIRATWEPVDGQQG